jgi:alanyl-tRNA synthetase
VPPPTERIYRADPYAREFEARVLQAREAAAPTGGSGARPAGPSLEVVLDRTAFYPGGGGQPADTGTLAGAPIGGIREEPGGAVVHAFCAAGGPLGAADGLTALAALLEPGATVRGALDFARRLDLMRHHTGQHLLSAALLRRMGAETVSVHFADAEGATCSLDLARAPLSEAEVDAAEDEALRVLLEDRPVTSGVHALEDAPSLGLRKPPPADQMAPGEGLRVVTIEGYDVSACCGTHVRRTGEIGPIRIVGQEKVRGQARLRFVVGPRALAEGRRRQKDAADALERAAAARRAAERRAEALEARLAERIAAEWAAGVAGAAGAGAWGGGAPPVGPLASGEARGGAAAVVLRALGPDDPRPEWIADALAKAGLRAALARPRAAEEGGGLDVALARPAAAPGPDVAALGKSLLGARGAKGGGKPAFARFTLPAGAAVAAAEEVLAALAEGLRA